MQSLHNLRKLIIKKLYREEFCEEDGNIFFEFYGKDLAREDTDWIDGKIDTISKNLQEIDELIKKSLMNWDIERVGIVERQILRLSIAEILFYPEVPIPVAMDEAIRLGKEFCGLKASSFINGILEAVARKPSK
ncbi:transcription antitermination factor NusB [candidate division WOR-3 bacterium]|nr:transcription antitermination factor NusB [candidate division WOR-3 bacterium]